MGSPGAPAGAQRSPSSVRLQGALAAQRPWQRSRQKASARAQIFSTDTSPKQSWFLGEQTSLTRLLKGDINFTFNECGICRSSRGHSLEPRRPLGKISQVPAITACVWAPQDVTQPERTRSW